MIDVAISQYLRTNILLVNNRVSQNLGRDNVKDAQIVFYIDPIGQKNYAGGGAIGFVDILTIAVYAKAKNQLDAIQITEEVDEAMDKLCNRSLDGFVVHTAPKARWRLIQLARSEQIIYQRQYWFNSK